jgi:hypothetical protein
MEGNMEQDQTLNNEEIIQKITETRSKQGREIQPSTMKVYINNINALSKMMNDGKSVAGFEWLENKDSVMEKLEEKKLNFTTIRNYLNAVIIYLYAFSENGSLDPLIKQYEIKRDELNQQYDEMNASNLWSDNQSKNMITRADLDNVITQIGTEIKQQKLKEKCICNVNQKGLLQTYLILNIHRTLPLRNELGCCKVMRKREYNKQTQEMKNKTNYLLIEKNNMTFHFNDFKTQKKYGERVIDIPSNLKRTIRFYLRFFPDEDYLLCKWNGEPIGTNNVSQLLTKQFKKRIGKSVSTTLLRKLYLSDKYMAVKDQLKDMETDNHIAGHSQATALKVYTKPNPNDLQE